MLPDPGKEPKPDLLFIRSIGVSIEAPGAILLGGEFDAIETGGGVGVGLCGVGDKAERPVERPFATWGKVTPPLAAIAGAAPAPAISTAPIPDGTPIAADWPSVWAPRAVAPWVNGP